MPSWTREWPAWTHEGAGWSHEKASWSHESASWGHEEASWGHESASWGRGLPSWTRGLASWGHVSSSRSDLSSSRSDERPSWSRGLLNRPIWTAFTRLQEPSPRRRPSMPATKSANSTSQRLRRLPKSAETSEVFAHQRKNPGGEHPPGPQSLHHGDCSPVIAHR